MIRLVSDGGALFTRLFASSVPVVVAAPGHAVAAGALLLLAADERIGSDGSFKIGLIETQIGMFLPALGDRARRGASEPSPLPGRDRRRAHVHAPIDARDAGYFDAVVAPEDLDATAQAAAEAWAKLPAAAYAAQVRFIRGARVAALEAAVAADRASGASPVTD